jgi:hypothetical protein
MSLRRFSRWGYSIPIACLLVAIASNATAQPASTSSQLGGWVYIDRNNDGHLAFSDEPNPEFVIGGVSISLYSVDNNVETLVSTLATDDYGRYLFANIAPGTYDLKEAQPIEYVDGIDTLGVLQSLDGQPIPPTASPGVATNDAFSNIVLTANVGGEFYNFGERGLAAGYASKRNLLASAPPLNTASPEPMSGMLALIAACGSGLLYRPRRR